jgi:hypothetical protein
MNEIPVNISEVPRYLYHIVPKDIFEKYLDEN